MLDGLARGEISPTPQPSEGVTYAGKIEKAEARIDWAPEAGQIERQVRAFNPWPVAETLLDGEQLRIHSARTSPIPGEDGAKSAEPGTILRAEDDFFAVRCGLGVLQVTQVQRPDASRSARGTSRTAMRCRGAALARTPWAPGAPALAAAARAVEAVASGGQSADAALAAAESTPERAAVRAITLGTLRWYLRLVPALEPLFSRPASVAARCARCSSPPRTRSSTRAMRRS